MARNRANPGPEKPVDDKVESELHQLETADDTQFYNVDPEIERKVVRKLDCVILPLMVLVYFFQYLDKQTINQAAVFGLRSDLKLTGQEFSWAVSLFYLGQLCSEYPAAIMLSRFPITIYVGVTIVIWGGVNMCLAAVHNFAGLAAVRFFLGFSEGKTHFILTIPLGTVSPAFIIITSIWYKRKEHPIRVATWVSMNGIANIIGALMMYGIGKGNMSLAPWRSLFLICGGLTSATGLLFIFLMPRDTTTAWFLSPQEREVATQRMAIDRATRDHAVFSKAQLKEALLSPMTWIYCLMGICITLTTPIMKVCQPSLSGYSSTVIHGFGYSTYKTMLVGTPAGAFNFITVWIGAIIPRVIPGTRVYTAIGLSIVPLLGSILLMTLPYSGGADWAIVVATWLGGCSSSLISSAASIIASNVKGNTKKSIVSTAFFVAYCVGCIVSPQAWTEDDAPRYTKGCILSIAAMACLILTFSVYVFMVKRLNRRRDRKASEGCFEYIVDRGDGSGRMGVSVDSDHTDVEDKAFRYTI
ncbi:MFS general substrate transporter [Aspergillus eucalypticola CBS 122712]|uniref:MFS general substrate transporter n=1 Tax=Aspergillus eucalypticola (strain CBS 122712 / IBT 29274) TaxID=1448314 RepID=A0A317VMH5_ASPEC|nr:MFS general substrate transporter [Aspergillus eucalypticola CBS 122712]PWY74128.1 MFS general substrate transporter [Aspergillus eucalypticola CBS 122712]